MSRFRRRFTWIIDYPIYFGVPGYTFGDWLQIAAIAVGAASVMVLLAY
jgi:hypothetical protein